MHIDTRNFVEAIAAYKGINGFEARYDAIVSKINQTFDNVIATNNWDGRTRAAFSARTCQVRQCLTDIGDVMFDMQNALCAAHEHYQITDATSANVISATSVATGVALARDMSYALGNAIDEIAN